jgi:hypothetical protein
MTIGGGSPGMHGNVGDQRREGIADRERICEGKG